MTSLPPGYVCPISPEPDGCLQPLVAVGLEGMWGMILCLLALPFLSAIKDSHGRPLDDLPAAISEVLGCGLD